MNNEIKEILSELENYYDRDIQLDEVRLIRDYITNLQQENKTLHENNQNMQEEMARTWKKYDDLQQENERLKEHNRFLENKIELYFDNVNMQNDLMTEQLNYKSCCEKAIEYIKNDLIPYGDEWHWDDGCIRDYVIILLNTLQNGGD